MADVDMEGIKALEDKLSKLSTALPQLIGQEIQASALTIVRNAQRAAPVDKGTLRAGISFIQLSPLNASITANARYSAYQEFGTGDFVSVPLGFEEYANAARGTGKRKVNIKPKPYLIPAILDEKPLLLARVKQIIEDTLS